MAIDRLSSTSALIAALRSDALRKGHIGRSGQGVAAKTPGRASTPSRPAIAQLRRELVDMVKDVALDDAEAVRKIRPRMVKAVLLWEFGPGLREHPEWQPIMDSIVQTLQADPAQDERMAALLRELKAR